jgi:hypothetical protein
MNGGASANGGTGGGGWIGFQGGFPLGLLFGVAPDAEESRGLVGCTNRRNADSGIAGQAELNMRARGLAGWLP